MTGTVHRSTGTSTGSGFSTSTYVMVFLCFLLFSHHPLSYPLINLNLKRYVIYDHVSSELTFQWFS